MEKLSLNKFQDVKLENKRMSYINAGECTGGGGSWTRVEIGSKYYETTITWDSDETGSCSWCGGTTYYGMVQTTVITNANTYKSVWCD